VIRGLGYGLDESAVAALRQWKFKPGTRNGETVATSVILSDMFGYDFGRYLHDLTDRVRTNWYSSMPPEGVKEKGRVMVIFTILRDGTLQDLKSSPGIRIASLDEAVTRAVEKSNPLAALPAEFKGDHLVIALTFRYNLQPDER